MTVFDDQLGAHSRTPQAILTLGVRYCSNWYSQTAEQHLSSPDEMAAWTATSVSVNTDAATDPEGGDTADEVVFNATNDAIGQTVVGEAVTSKAYTGSIWLRVASGTETVSLRIRNAGSTEDSTVQVTITETWTRFWEHNLFTGVPVDDLVFEVVRLAGDDATTVEVWRGNCTDNPGAEDSEVKFPSMSSTGNASSCTAADAGDGSRCFYTFPTCQDRANFNAGNAYEGTAGLRGFREYRFCMKDLPLPLGGEDIRPYIETAANTSMKLDPEKAVTTTERFSFGMADDAGPGLWDVDKSGVGALVNTQTGGGSFWRRWVVIHKNYQNPDNYSEYKVGFVADGMTGALYESRFRGLPQRLEIDGRGRVKLTCTDFLKKMKGEIPAKIGDGNVLVGTIDASAVSIPVSNVNELSALPTVLGDYAVTIKIDDEEMNVIAIDTDAETMTVNRGRWGTTAVAHTNGVAWSEVVEFGTELDSAGQTPTGKNPIDIVIELLKRGGIATADIDVAALETERDDWLASTIDTATGLTTGVAFRRTLEDPEKIEALINEIREVTQLAVWVNESQQVTGKVFAPVEPTEVLVELDETNELVRESVKVDDSPVATSGGDGRVTRVLVAYNLSADGDDEKLGDYQEIIVAIDAEAEAEGSYGEDKLKQFLSQWIRPGDDSFATSFLQRYLERFSNGVRLVSFALERKNDSIKVGDFVKVTTDKIQDAHGTTVPNRVMQILSKKRAGQGRQEHTALDTGLIRRTLFVAPIGTPVYDSQTDDEKRYGSIGAADTNLVGTPPEDGYYTW